jgi:hypothetical protein
MIGQSYLRVILDPHVTAAAQSHSVELSVDAKGFTQSSRTFGQQFPFLLAST